MRKSPPGILENRKDKRLAIILVLTTVLSVILIFYSIDKKKQVDELTQQLEQCANVKPSND